MIIVPDALQRAFERGIARYDHLTISASIPPVERPGIKITIGPPPGVYCWRLFGLVFGDLRPAGYSDKFVIIHRGPFTIEHEDPWVPSLVDVPFYPLTETLTEGHPHEAWIVNETEEVQTFDATIHFGEFRTRDDYNKYRAMVEEPSAIVRALNAMLRRLRP